MVESGRLPQNSSEILLPHIADLRQYATVPELGQTITLDAARDYDDFEAWAWFLVVFSTMFYAVTKPHKDNPIDSIRTENL